MATPTALAKRLADANKRIAEAGPHIAARLGIEFPTVERSKDPAVQRAREAEAFADFLEAADAELAARDAKPKAVATPATSASKAKTGTAKKDTDR